jgi:cold shock CspA family protein
VLGIVKSYDPRKRFGFIDSDDGVSFFAHQSSIVPDSFGRRILYAHDLVSFDPVYADTAEANAHQARPVATHVQPQNRPDEIMPADYWEECVVHSLVEKGRSGFLTRPCGDTIFFSRKSVRTYGDLIPKQTKVICGFRAFGTQWQAIDIDLLLPEFDCSEYLVYPETI